MLNANKMFTQDEIEELTKESLLRLAKHLDLSVTTRNTKAELIEKIKDQFPKYTPPPDIIPEAIEPEVPRYSVRLKRILESKGEL